MMWTNFTSYLATKNITGKIHPVSWLSAASQVSLSEPIYAASLWLKFILYCAKNMQMINLSVTTTISLFKIFPPILYIIYLDHSLHNLWPYIINNSGDSCLSYRINLYCQTSKSFPVSLPSTSWLWSWCRSLCDLIQKFSRETFSTCCLYARKFRSWTSTLAISVLIMVRRNIPKRGGGEALVHKYHQFQIFQAYK